MAGYTATRWLSEITQAEKRRDKWFQRCERISARYRDERNDGAMSQGLHIKRKFNILWSNVQTMTPSLYARAPQPIAERRFLDHDPTGRIAATILERCLRYEIEENGFDEVMRACVLDYQLTGQAVPWVRYEPEFGEALSPHQEGETYNDAETDQNGSGGYPYDAKEGVAPSVGGSGALSDAAASQGNANGDDQQYGDAGLGGPAAQLLNECVPIDYVHWKDFLTSEARYWAEVTWVARRIYMGREQMVKRFGKIGHKVPMEKPRDVAGRYIPVDQQASATKAEVFEIWDKDGKQVCFAARGFGELLEELPPPIKLQDFWPCPKPLFGTMTHDTLIPVPDYAEYQDQAEELDSLTNRIDALTKALKVAGVYDASAPALQQLLNDTYENRLLPVESWAMFAQKGGLDGAISWLPIKDIAAVLVQLQEAFEITLKRLYEITGIADIIRGQSDPRETLGAQQLKGNFASQRIADRQREVARFARDVLRIMAEIIAEQYSPETLIMKSSIMEDDGLTEDQPAAPPSPMMGHNGGPPMQPMLQGPAGGVSSGAPPGLASPLGAQAPPALDPQTMKMQQIAQAITLLREEKLRGFRIEIETDSTIQPDAMQEKQARTEFVTAMTGFIQQMIAGAQAMPAVIPLAAKTLQWAARGFRVGRDLESAIDRFISQANQQASAGQQQPSPEAIKAQAEQQKQAMEGQRMQAQAQIDMLQARMDIAQQQQKQQFEERMKLLEAQLQMMQAQAEARQTARDEERAQADHQRAMAEMAMGAEVAREQASAKIEMARQKPAGGAKQ